MENKFYLTSRHGGVGSSVMFWRVNGAGYTSNIDEAHIYTQAEMQEQANKGYFDHEHYPLSVKQVDELSEWRVDHQYLPDTFLYDFDQVVCIAKGKYDGNDVYFVSDSGLTTDYSEAIRFTISKSYHTYKGVRCEIYPAELIDQIARRTFQFKNINRRKMITSAGVTGIRKKRKRNPSGKTMMNCPLCGRINWQFNPYEFDVCSNHRCDNHFPF